MTFDPAYPTAILLGLNGTGKSNVLEALVLLFTALDTESEMTPQTNSTPPFYFELTYECRGSIIDIVADPEADIHTVVNIDGKELSPKKFFTVRREYLPNNIVAYYSGVSERMKNLFVAHNEAYYRDAEAGNRKSFRRFFFCDPLHSQVLLLSYMHSRDKAAAKRLKEIMDLEAIASAMFTVKEPGWKPVTPNEKQLRDGDERFWYAQGVAMDFLSNLASNSLAPINMRQPAKREYPWQDIIEEDHWCFYLPNAKQLSKFVSEYYNAVEFFSAFDICLMSDLIRDVFVKVNRSPDTGSHDLDFEYLSEGEKQILTVLGLVSLLQEDETLFLLDEPDTHLNPRWKVKYLELVRDCAAKNDNDQLIIATHDPLLISSAERRQINILRNTQGGITADHPAVSPKGLGVSGILTSDMFEMSSELDSETEEMLAEQANLFAKKRKSKRDRERLREVSDNLASLGFINQFRDPLYSLFVKELARRDEFTRPKLSADEIEAQEKFAATVIDQLLTEP